MKTILILLLLPMLCYAQDMCGHGVEGEGFETYSEILPVEEETELVTILSLIKLYDEYADGCYADSVVVGLRFIEYEQKSNMGYNSIGMDVYNRQYKDIIDEDFITFLPHGYTFDEEGICFWHYRTCGINLNYIRCEEIKQSQQPTFEGFIEFLRKKWTIENRLNN